MLHNKSNDEYRKRREFTWAGELKALTLIALGLLLRTGVERVPSDPTAETGGKTRVDRSRLCARLEICVSWLISDKGELGPPLGALESAA